MQRSPILPPDQPFPLLRRKGLRGGGSVLRSFINKLCAVSQYYARRPHTSPSGAFVLLAYLNASLLQGIEA